MGESDHTTIPRLSHLRLIRRSLVWYWRPLLVLALAIATAVAVLAGAVVVGWSMQQSLSQRLIDRIGQVRQVAIASRPVPASLVDGLRAHGMPAITGALELSGNVGLADDELGVSVPATLWAIGPSQAWPADMPDLGDSGVALNEHLATQLHAKRGDALSIRADCSPLLQQTGLFAPRKPGDLTRLLRLEVRAVIPESRGGDFTLQQSQVTAANLFVPLAAIARAADVAPSVNRLILPTHVASEQWNRSLQPAADLPDMGISLRKGTRAEYLQSATIQLSEPIVAAVRKAVPNAQPTCTFIAEEFSSGSRHVSYGVIASSASSHLSDDQIILNDWVAHDLGVRSGDRLSMSVLISQPDGSFARQTVQLQVSGVLPIGQDLFDSAVVPDVPGMTQAKQMDQWKTPFPVDMSKVTGRDEQYWDQYRATPKAIISDNLIQRFWRASGSPATPVVTALMLSPGTDTPEFREQLVARLVQDASPLALVDVQQQAHEAGTGSSDFAGLFAGMSIFLVIAALVIAVAVVRIAIEARAGELGLASALGVNARPWRTQMLIEQAVATIPGIALGIILGIAYAKLLLWIFVSLSRDVWEIPPVSLAIRLPELCLAGGVIALLVIVGGWWEIRRQNRRDVREMLWGISQLAPDQDRRNRWLPTWLSGRVAPMLALLALVGAIVSIVLARHHSLAADSAFFIASMALLVAAYLLAMWLLTRSLNRQSQGLTFTGLCWRTVLSGRRRALLAATVYAVAAFTLCSVALYRVSAGGLNPHDLHGPTGGFVTRITSPIAYRYDLATEAARERLGLSDASLGPGVEAFSLPASGGSEGGCLNLAKPTEMQILGITRGFIERSAFEVTTDRPGSSNPWHLLDAPSQDAIPVFGDEETMQWILQHSLGDTFEMPLGGHPRTLKLAGLVRGGLFSGQLLMSEANYRRLFPSDLGYRVHFIAAPAGVEPKLAGFRELGMTVEPTVQIINAVQSVQHLYMTLFLILGGLGLLLGLSGSAVLLVRDALQRRSELALLQAMGLSRAQCTSILASAHFLPLLSGLVAGSAAALVAYQAIQRPISPWAITIPVAAALISAVLISVAAYVLQPRRTADCLRAA